ncbi:hypothetical protein TSTA_115600 [Talaromyces stipitatus ATCC 10500]|uniref:Uncharacterized protein n=1 Tax=Talaromyces stipitatus (strain ATCC 10500 / CBS 375.48 / QM 6759 / NRRL 1006) TaxID=441959 RepID=B8MAS5_TALSN|nr:uncharacterized protein TSTA_115600 [Talaromyces stipitatus ATCC 10500]EED17765.1 hypothetical protein TSTA_115600 [Talaromyces stipitatus ATCC 10500]
MPTPARAVNLRKLEPKIDSSRVAAVVAANGRDEQCKGASCMADDVRLRTARVSPYARRAAIYDAYDWTSFNAPLAAVP